MQFKVPQDVQREDRIVGPLTFRQLVICGIGFTLAYTVFTIVGRDYELITALIPVGLITIITIVFAFANPLDLPFERWILFLLESKILPRKRFWLKGTGDPSRMSYIPPVISAKPVPQKKDTELSKKKSLEELSKILDKKL